MKIEMWWEKNSASLATGEKDSDRDGFIQKRKENRFVLNFLRPYAIYDIIQASMFGLGFVGRQLTGEAGWKSLTRPSLLQSDNLPKGG